MEPIWPLVVRTAVRAVTWRVVMACIALVLMVFSMGANAATEDCTTLPGDVPPATNYRYVTATGPAGICPNNNSGTVGQYYDTAAALIASKTAPGSCGFSTCALQEGPNFCGLAPNGDPFWQFKRLNGSGGGVRWQTFQRTAGGTTNCVLPEDECAAGKFSMIGNRGVTFASAMGSLTDRCWGSCKVNITPTGPGMNKECSGGVCTWEWLGSAKTTGEQCNPPADAPVPNPVIPEPEDGLPFEQYADGENCVVSAAGVENCDSFDPQRSNENCGYVNDEFRCLDKISQDNCWVMPSGGRLCGEGAVPPTAPTAPAPAPKSQTATPTDQMASNSSGNTYNYYNSTVVGQSQRPVTPDGSNPVTGSPGAAGDGEGEEEGGGTASGGDDCTAPPTCDGDPIACAQLMQQWRQRCPNPLTEAEMRSGITDTGVGADGTFPEGSSIAIGEADFDAGGFLGGRSCPIPASFDMNEFGSIGFDTAPACALLNALAAMILAAGWLTAARVAFGP
jgi:hypothetical protein